MSELAHWRYRIGAIEREIEFLNKSVHRLRRAIAGLRWTGGDPSPRLRYDDEIDELLPLIEANKYLLEEARYMVELKSIEQGVSQ